MKGVTESLAGRIAIINMLGLSHRELHGLALKDVPFIPTESMLESCFKDSVSSSLREIYDEIWRGSFPGFVLNKDIEKNVFYSSYLQTYLQRDIQHLTKIHDELDFIKFVRATAARTGQLLNISDLANDVNISHATAKSWISVLRASGIIYLLEPYHTNVTSRLIKSPKLYFLDTGLCSYLTQWSTSEALEAGAMSGAILETFVVGEIIKSFWNNGKQASIYYYRDKDQREIDVVIVQDQTIYPLEIKKTGSPIKQNIASFVGLERLGLKVGYGGIICMIDKLLPLTSKASAIPVSML